MKLKHYLVAIALGATLVVLTVFLISRYQLGQTQHFDLDELAYLHWASHYVSGSRPYRDFFFFGTPGYLWFIAPAFIFSKGIAPFFAGRVLAFGAYALLAAASGWLFWEVRRSWLAALVPVIILFLPLPGIKFSEVRPDTLAVLFVVLGLVFTVRYLKHWQARDGVLAGTSLALSSLVFLKSAPMVAVAALTVTAASWGKKRERLAWFVLGMAATGALFGAWLVSLGWQSWGMALYSLTKLATEATQLGKLFPIEANFFFYPNQLFYGTGEEGRWVNHGLWLGGMLVGTVRLLTPWLPAGKKGVWQELLLGISWLSYLIFFVYISPFKHSQYLIPLAVFAVWYAADGVYLLWTAALRRPATLGLIIVLYLIGLWYLTKVFFAVNQTRMTFPVAGQIAPVQEIWKRIPTSEPILDLEGITLYYPDPYYVCCIPFGQFAHFLSRPLPELTTALETTNTKYIYAGGRLETLTRQDQQYVLTNFSFDPALNLFVRH